MVKTLRDLYPNDIRERSEILREIMGTAELRDTYESWTLENQEHFLDFCSGSRGVKMLRDGFFKEILNPDTKPQRLEELLSLLLKQKITIRKVLPNDSSRISDESALLTMDIVVQLEDGSLANVECQRIGYAFMGQRAACYSADLLLRQYKRIRNKKKKKFSYKDVQKVYSIIFYENSPAVFKEYPNNTIHYFQQTSNTGLSLDLLQEFIFIPLDITNKIYQNDNVIDNKLDAWFIFLSNDDPKTIAKLIAQFPEFKQMYHEIYEVCKNTKWVMNMFSEELRILDKNTELLMLEEAKAEIEQMCVELGQKVNELNQANTALDQANTALDQANTALNQKTTELGQVTTALDLANTALDQKTTELDQVTTALNLANTALDQKTTELDQATTALDLANTALDQKNTELQKKNTEIEQKDAEIEQKDAEIEQKDAEIELLKKKLAELQRG